MSNFPSTSKPAPQSPQCDPQLDGEELKLGNNGDTSVDVGSNLLTDCEISDEPGDSAGKKKKLAHEKRVTKSSTAKSLDKINKTLIELLKTISLLVEIGQNILNNQNTSSTASKPPNQEVPQPVTTDASQQQSQSQRNPSSIQTSIMDVPGMIKQLIREVVAATQERVAAPPPSGIPQELLQQRMQPTQPQVSFGQAHATAPPLQRQSMFPPPPPPYNPLPSQHQHQHAFQSPYHYSSQQSVQPFLVVSRRPELSQGTTRGVTRNSQDSYHSRLVQSGYDDLDDIAGHDRDAAYNPWMNW